MQADALETGLPSNELDGVVMAYGLRNLSDPESGLKEIHRLLKPGARAGLLDFNRAPDSSLLTSFQRFYLRLIVVPIASLLGFHDQYAYLEKSLKHFPEGKILAELALRNGFVTAEYRLLAGGLMGALLLKA